MSIQKNIQYMEGMWAGARMVPQIHNTTYSTLEGAVIAKTTLVEQFESQLGFSREMENPDPKYAYELGILDALKEAYEKSNPDTTS